MDLLGFGTWAFLKIFQEWSNRDGGHIIRGEVASNEKAKGASVQVNLVSSG